MEKTHIAAPAIEKIEMPSSTLPAMIVTANLRARDIIGYTTVAMVVRLVIVMSWLTVFCSFSGLDKRLRELC